MKYHLNRDNVNDDIVMVRAIYVESGSLVAEGDKVLDYETSKTVVQIAAENAGKCKLFVTTNQEISIGGLLFEIQDPNHQDDEVIKEPSVINQKSEMTYPDSGLHQFSNEARKYALAHEINLGKVALKTSWVLKRDLIKAPDVHQEAQKLFFSSNIDGENEFEGVFHKHSLRKKAEIKSLQVGNEFSLNSTIGVQFSLEGQRNAQPPFIFENNISDILIYESSRLFKKYPELNSYAINSEGYRTYDEVNFGVSFDSGSNLKVLALKDADKKTLSQIQCEFENLLFLYESGEAIEKELLTASTVTISDLSGFSISNMLPLLNGQQSMIMGVTRDDYGDYGIHITFDHRVAEGYRVSKFLLELKERVKSYFLMEPICYFCERGLVEEKNLGNKGLLNIIINDGRSVPICKNCYMNY